MFLQRFINSLVMLAAPFCWSLAVIRPPLPSLPSLRHAQVETGSAITWKYPSVVLKGEYNSTGEFYSVALTNNRQQADTGTKVGAPLPSLFWKQAASRHRAIIRPWGSPNPPLRAWYC